MIKFSRRKARRLALTVAIVMAAMGTVQVNEARAVPTVDEGWSVWVCKGACVVGTVFLCEAVLVPYIGPYLASLVCGYGTSECNDWCDRRFGGEEGEECIPEEEGEGGEPPEGEGGEEFDGTCDIHET
jgi:hypothetical protein